MEPVGFFGILKLTTRIICKNLKHFLCIAILCAIPYAFHLPVLDHVSSFSLHSLVDSLYMQLTASKQLFPPASKQLFPPSPAPLPPPHGPDPPFLKLHLASLIPLIARFSLSISISLISLSLLAFSVCRACLDKRLSLRGSLLGTLTSAKSLALTSLCLGVVIFGYICMAVGLVGIIGLVLALVMGNDSAGVSVPVNWMLIAMALGGVYMGILFSLAQTVAILEEKARGWGAMKRSMDLVKGRKWMALGLVCVFYGLEQPCESGKLWGWRGARMVRVSLQAVVALFGMAAHIVLYASCKQHKEEPLNRVVAARAEFGPSQAQSMDVETAAFLPAALPK